MLYREWVALKIHKSIVCNNPKYPLTLGITPDIRKEVIKVIYFTADMHFGHENVIKFDNRPFKSLEEMDEELIKRWNNKVGKADLVYSLGDMFWKNQDYVTNILKRLNGQIILIKGNHDRWLHNAKNKSLLAGLKDYDEITIDSKKIVLSHYPIHFYNGHYHGAIMLYGHTHSTREDDFVKQIASQLNNLECPVQMYNVGCMHWNYEPVSLDEILMVKNQM